MTRLILRSMIVTLAVTMLGCANVLPADPTKMSPEQLKAAAKDKNAAVACSNGKTAAGNVTLVYVNLDQAMRLGSSAVVEPDCRVTLSTTSQPASAASAPL